MSLPPPETPRAEPFLAAPNHRGPLTYTVRSTDGTSEQVVAASYDEEGDDYVFRDDRDRELVRYPVDQVAAVTST